MDENQKSLVVHYLTEFIIGSIGLGILTVLLWFREFEISLQLFSAWIFIFNGVLLPTGYGRIKRKYGKNLLLAFISF